MNTKTFLALTLLAGIVYLLTGCGSTIELGYSDQTHGSFRGSYTVPKNYSK